MFNWSIVVDVLTCDDSYNLSSLPCRYVYIADIKKNMSSDNEDSHKTPAKKKKKNSSVERKTFRCKVYGLINPTPNQLNY